jgi:hypothetical protein
MPAGSEFDPYAPPEAPLAGATTPRLSEDLAAAETVRRAHLTHEASVKSIGSLHYLSVIFGVLGLVFTLFQAVSGNQPLTGGLEGARLVGMLVYLLALTAINLAMAIGLTKLKPWARWAELVFTALSLIYCVLVAVGIGRGPAGPGVGIAVFFGMMIIPAYILYLLLSTKASVVFSPEYREIIERTPHIKYKTSWLVKGCLIVFLAIIVLSIVMAILSGRR